MQPDGTRLVRGNREHERREGLWDGESASGFLVQDERQVLRAAPLGAATKHKYSLTREVELVRVRFDGISDTVIINVTEKLCFDSNHIIHYDGPVGVYKSIIDCLSNHLRECI